MKILLIVDFSHNSQTLVRIALILQTIILAILLIYIVTQILDFKTRSMTTKDILKMLKSEMNDKANEASKKMYMSKDNDLAKEFHHGQYMAYSSVYTMLELQLSHLESRETPSNPPDHLRKYPLTPDECFKNNEDEK